VNNAGEIQVGPIHTMTVKDFEDAMNVMFWGTVFTTLAVLPHMRQRGDGRIVNVTSVGAKVSVPHLVPYSCAKFRRRLSRKAWAQNFGAAEYGLSQSLPGSCEPAHT